MSSASRSKSKDKKGGKEPPKAASKPSSVNAGGANPTSGYNPLLGTFHTLETGPVTSNAALHVNGRFRNIDDTDDHSGRLLGAISEYDSVSNNDSWSGESEDHKEKTSNPSPRQEAVPGADNDKREKIRQKNERKHQRQKERRAQELHEKCSGYLMSRKLEALAQQLVGMGFSSERATMALIFKEGKVEESIAWLVERCEETETDKHKECNLDGEGSLKIDISEEVACIADMEIRYKCSKQEVERAVVACEGDLEKAEETLRSQKLESASVLPKPEESGDPYTVGNGKFPIATSQILPEAPFKFSSSSTISQKRDEKDFNYTKVAASAGSFVDCGSKNLQSSKRLQPKLDWAKQPQAPVPAEKRWPIAGPSPVSNSLACSLQASLPSTNTEARYVAVANELKNLQLGTVREPVTVMQRPRQSVNPKQTPASSVSSSPPETAAGWYPNSIAETMKPNGLMPHTSGTRSMSPNDVSPNQVYNQLHYQQHQQGQQFVSSNGSLESPGTRQVNSLWNRTGVLQTQTVAAASSLGLFSGLGSSITPGSSSSVDWNCSPMLQLDYTNIDWSLDRRSLSSRTCGTWPTTNYFMQDNARTYDSFTGLGVTTTMRPVSSNGGGVTIPVLQDRAAKVESSAGVSREWASPFEEKDLFSLRHFVFSPSL